MEERKLVSYEINIVNGLYASNEIISGVTYEPANGVITLSGMMPACTAETIQHSINQSDKIILIDNKPYVITKTLVADYDNLNLYIEEI